MARFIWVTLCLAMLSGCAGHMQYQQVTAEYRQAKRSGAEQWPAKFELQDVPFHPQRKYHCGPASLATLMNWAGDEIHPDELAPHIYLDERQGSLQVELLAATRRQDLLPYVQPPQFDALMEQIRSGEPVLVLQNLGLNWAPIWHYAVVIGYDLEAKEIILRSGTTKRELQSFRSFERSWKRAGYWAISVHRPGELPANPEQEKYLQAAVGLEKAGRMVSAQQTYATASQRWPESLIAWMGLGNTAFHQQNYILAEANYRQALVHHPRNAAPHHNLAWALIRQRLYNEARPHAEQAVEFAQDGEDHYRGALVELNKNQ